MLVALTVVFLQNTAEFAQGAIDLKGAGEMILLRSLAELEKLLHVLGAVDEFLDLGFGHARRSSVLGGSDQVVLNNIAVHADEAIDRIIGDLFLLANLNSELQQFDALGVAAGGVVDDGRLEPAGLVVLARKAANTRQTAVAVNDAAVVKHDARPQLAAERNALLSLLESPGVALDDKALNGPVVLFAPKRKQVSILRSVVLAYPRCDAIVLVVVEQQVALDAIDVKVTCHVINGVFFFATCRQNVAGCNSFVKQAHCVPPFSMLPWMNSMRLRCHRSRHRNYEPLSSGAAPDRLCQSRSQADAANHHVRFPHGEQQPTQ